MPKEKKAPKEKRRRGGRGAAVLILVGLIIIALLVIVFFDPFGWGIGLGNGSGNIFGGSGNNSAATDDAGSPADDEPETNIVVIRIDTNDIYLDDELCADADELKEKITVIGTEKEYELIHDTAIKSTFDEVKKVLSDLEDALGITVNYNE